MPTNKSPAPVDTGQAAPAPVGPLDKSPAPVPQGTSTGVYPSATGSNLPQVTSPKKVAISSKVTDETILPVTEQAVDVANTVQVNTNISTTLPRYVNVYGNGTLVVQAASTFNFTGNGVTVTSGNSSGSAQIAITGGGGNAVIDWNNIGNNILPSSTNTYDIGSGSNRWATLYTVSVGATGDINAGGNISGNYILGNGSQLTGISAAGSSNKIFNGSSYANIATANGNFVINAGNIGSWTFGTDGNLTIPGGGKIDTNGGTAGEIDLRAGSNIAAAALASYDNLNYMYVDNSGAYVSTNGNKQWVFGTDGTLTLPNNAVIKDTAGDAVAIGAQAGNTSQGNAAVAIGNNAGQDNQGIQSVAIGSNAGYTTQSNSAVAIGNAAGNYLQSANAVAVGDRSGSYTQGASAVAVGQFAGNYLQGENAMAIGNSAGQASQGQQAVAIGWYAGNTSQAPQSVAIGTQAGYTGQGSLAVAIGIQSGYDTQGNNSVAIGRNAGYSTQGANAVAIGSKAGPSSQANNSIIINATGNNLNQTTANTFTVAPVRNDVANVAQVMFYNATSKEITYGNTISIAGNINGGNLLTGGLISATGNITGGNALFSGNLTVNGNVTYINSNVVTINDLAINLANNAANVTQVNGGGIELGPQGTPYVTFLYNNSANTFTSNVGLSAVANISGGNVLTAGLISATANITGGNITTAGVLKISGASSYIDVAGTGFIQNGGTGELQISSVASKPVWINTNAGSKLWTFGIDGNLALPAGGAVSGTGNITGGNVLTGGLISSTGNITGGNILTAGIMSSTGNATHGNIITAGLITATGNISGGNLTITGNTATITTANYSVGYLNIPQVSLAANTTTVLTDSGKHYYSVSASNLALTIANNTSVVWPVGTAISVVNRGTANITVAGDTGVSLYLAGNATAGNRIVTTYGMATVMNVAANILMISGTVV